MNFDSDLMDPEIDPQIIVLTDAPQLVNLPGKLGGIANHKEKIPTIANLDSRYRRTRQPTTFGMDGS